MNVDAIILPADSENTIVNGLNAERYPAEFAGGIGEQGVENLKKFVENGGKLICFDDSCEMVIKRFNLPIKNVLNGLKRSEFYNPGSIVQIESRYEKSARQRLERRNCRLFYQQLGV